MAGNDERLFLHTGNRRLIWPVPDRTSSLFRETDPRPALERHIAKIRWGHERIPDSGLRERIVPDGAVRLVFVFPVGDLPPYGLAVGASSQPAIVELAGDIQHLEVELRAGAIPALFGIPAAELSDRAVPLHELWGDRAAIGQERLLTAADSGQRVAIIQDTLARLLRDAGPDLPSVMMEAQRRIARAAGNLRVSTLADELGISDRRLEQLFRLHVGAVPENGVPTCTIPGQPGRATGDAGPAPLLGGAGAGSRVLRPVAPGERVPVDDRSGAPAIPATRRFRVFPRSAGRRWVPCRQATKESPNMNTSTSTNPRSNERPLAGKIAVVTGASRGGGKGIAVELGAAGATVYVTGRSTRQAPATSYDGLLKQAGLTQLPGSIEDTAEEVTRAGGQGIPVRCDHTDESQVGELIARVIREQDRLDLLVNNAWGAHETFTAASLSAPFWEQPLDHWHSMFDRGVRNHVVSCRAAAPILIKQKAGLIVTTTFWDHDKYLKGNLFYDLAKSTMNRLAFAVAEELRPSGVTSLAVAPGWMRTEFVLMGFKATEATWHQHPALARTESPRYLGRAVAALAADPRVHDRTGRVHLVGDLARAYGFQDIDGRVIPPFEM